ncbi:MAG: TetR/AcrR family transcriptional regulator [Marinovum sp.]|nr:TetR/AcrR family transcriptional regulator [Marinovum sp.]
MAADGGQATQTPQVRRGRKFDQVLSGARDVFMAHGYEGASVDDIARAAGVSKATLYSYFPDKQLLFMEVAGSECIRQAEMALDQIDIAAPPRDVLTAMGMHFVTFILSDFGRAVFRICVAESLRFPEIGRQFYQNGPMVMRTAMVNYLQLAASRGELEIDEYELAAEQFGELCKSDVWLKRTFNIIDTVSKDDMVRVVNSAVDTWLARYGAKAV